MVPRLSFTLVIILVWCREEPLQAQPRYTIRDSIEIFSLLDKADGLDLSGDLDAAKRLVEQAEKKSIAGSFLRGQGHAVLKRADLQLKKEGKAEVLSLCNQGIRIGIELRDSFIVGLGHHQAGQYYRDLVRYDSAVYRYTVAANWYDQFRHADYLAILYNDIGFIKERQGEYEEAIGINLKAMRLFKSLGNIKELANSLGNQGVIFYRLNNKPEAIRLFKESARYREGIGDIKGLAAIYGNLATAYGSISLDSAVHYQFLALNQALKTGVKANMAQANTNAAMLLGRQKKYVEAIRYEQEAIRLFEEMGEQSKIANRYIALAQWYNLAGDSLRAEMQFTTAQDIATGLQSKPILQNIYLQKASFYRDHGNFRESLANQLKYQDYKDSLLNEKSLQNIAEMQAKYESEKKDFEITRLSTDQKLKQLELINQKALLKSSVLEREKNLDHIRLLEQEQELAANRHAQEQARMAQDMKEIALREELLKKEKLLADNRAGREKWIRNLFLVGFILLLLFSWGVFNRYQLKQKVKAQERLLSMRNAISKDLHDEVGSTLTSISVLSKAGQLSLQREPAATSELLTQISNQSKMVQQNLSDIVWSIRPDTARAEFLVSRIREFAALTLEPENIAVDIQAEEELMNRSLDELKRKEILLIVKEAINNILKHAQADRVEINCTKEDGQLVFSIWDNGHWKNKPEYTGTGLTSMKERALKIGGDLRIILEDSGTRVRLQIPEQSLHKSGLPGKARN